MKRRARYILVAAAMALTGLAAPSVRADDFYVDIENGNNQTGDGLTTETAWRNLTYALTQITGTTHTIHLAAGTYDTSADTSGVAEVYPIYRKPLAECS